MMSAHTAHQEPSFMRNLLSIALFCGIAYGAAQLIPGSAAKAAPFGQAMSCKQLDSLYASMAQYKVGIIATGIARAGGQEFDVMVVRGQTDGSWMLMGVDAKQGLACELVSGPKITFAIAS
jgi:hypothetical protein